MYEYREQLLEAIEKFQVLIVTAETGSGKTTQVCPPLHLAFHEASVHLKVVAGLGGFWCPHMVAASWHILSSLTWLQLQVIAPS